MTNMFDNPLITFAVVLLIIHLLFKPIEPPAWWKKGKQAIKDQDNEGR